MSGRRLAVLLALAACGRQPSVLDGDVSEATKSNDPWASDSNDDATPTPSDGKGFGGFDFAGMFSKITESMKQPGFYEMPEKSADFDPGEPHLGVLALGGKIVERTEYSFSLFGGGGRGNELRKVVTRFRDFAKDEKLKGLVLRISDLDISLPDVVELRGVMHEVRAAGKTIECHIESASNAGYLLLAACDRIGIAPLGQIAITGPAAMPIHVKGLLDKLGVQADFLHVGAYKGAAEPLTRDAPSQEMETTLREILDRHYETMVTVIAKDRKLDRKAVEALIDTGLYASEQALAAKLVDEVGSFESFRDHLATGVAGTRAKLPWTKVELEPGAGGDKLTGMLSVWRFLGAMPPDRPVGDHVAVIYAIGNIVDGEGDGVLGARSEIASHTLVSALRALTADDAVKAVVLRIDSGGGSAQASELIWRAVNDLKAKKPVIVSMSDVAASGGYYIASNATRIYALDNTLTGSIGVVGGKIAPGNALAKIGVSTFPRGRGRRATILASFSPWNDEEKQVIQKSMEEVYTVFTGRVADGRKIPLDKVKELAQGRVWTGAKAKELGLVDEIGGLDVAIAKARELGKVDAEADLEIYPPSPTLRDFVQGWGGNVSMGRAGSTILGGGLGAELAGLDAIDPRLADTAKRLLDLVLSFRTTSVQALAILPDVR
jgi:protease-4